MNNIKQEMEKILQERNPGLLCCEAEREVNIFFDDDLVEVYELAKMRLLTND